MIQRFNKALFSMGRGLQCQILARNTSVSSKASIKEMQNELFDMEKEKQRESLGRLEKIEVKYLSPTDEVLMIMNKNISTPHDCAKHVTEGVSKITAIAVVNNELWDMHRPLPNSCTLRFINMRSPEKHAVNSAFWRTCSFILGAAVDSAFKSDFQLHLHSFTWPNIKSGSFVHDVYIDLPNWKPTEAELKSLSASFARIVHKELPIERLQVSEELASKMFKDNPFKFNQIPSIVENNDNKVTLYRVGDHIDMSKGPMIGNSSNIGRCSITSVHQIETEDCEPQLYRFQGVAIPSGILMNHFAYSILEARAKKLNNTTWMPVAHTNEIANENIAVALQN